MDVNDFKIFVELIARKSQSGGNWTPAQFNVALEKGYLDWIDERYNALEGKDSHQVNIENSDDLRFLMTSKRIRTDSTGKLFIPDGTSVLDLSNNVAPKYLHLSSMRKLEYTQSGTETPVEKEIHIKVVRNNELSSILNSTIVAPDADYPHAAIYDTYYQLWPKEECVVILEYLKIPDTPRWGYLLDSNGRPYYTSGTGVNGASVDIEAPDNNAVDIASKVLSYLGVSIRDPQLFNYAQMMEQKA